MPMYSFYNDLRVLRREAKPSAARQISDFMQVRFVAKIVGVQYSIAYGGFFFFGFLFSSIAVVFVDPNLRQELGTWLLDNCGFGIGFILVLLFQHFFLDGYIFENKFSQGRMIKEPRSFGTMMVLMAFYGIFTGLFTVIVRFIIGFGFTAMAICRLDICVLPPHMASKDNSFR